jgi:hypothetical protein
LLCCACRYLLRDFQRVVNLDTGIPNRAFELCMAKQQVDGAQITRGDSQPIADGVQISPFAALQQRFSVAMAGWRMRKVEI